MRWRRQTPSCTPAGVERGSALRQGRPARLQIAYHFELVQPSIRRFGVSSFSLVWVSHLNLKLVVLPITAEVSCLSRLLRGHSPQQNTNTAKCRRVRVFCWGEWPRHLQARRTLARTRSTSNFGPVRNWPTFARCGPLFSNLSTLRGFRALRRCRSSAAMPAVAAAVGGAYALSVVCGSGGLAWDHRLRLARGGATDRQQKKRVALGESWRGPLCMDAPGRGPPRHHAVPAPGALGQDQRRPRLRQPRAQQLLRLDRFRPCEARRASVESSTRGLAMCGRSGRNL